MKFIIKNIPEGHFMYTLNGMTFEEDNYRSATRKIIKIYIDYQLLIAKQCGFVLSISDMNQQAQLIGNIIPTCLFAVPEEKENKGELLVNILDYYDINGTGERYGKATVTLNGEVIYSNEETREEPFDSIYYESLKNLCEKLGVSFNVDL